MKFRNSNGRIRRPLRRANIRSIIRPRDPIITAQRFPIPSAHIPQFNAAPSVQRVVRILVTLTSASMSYNLTYAAIAAQDATYYTGSTTVRYATMRVSHLKVWAESPNSLSVSQAPYGLYMSEETTGFTITDRPTTGSRLAAIGMTMPFNVRTGIFDTVDTSVIATIGCDQAIAASTDFLLTIDSTVEFYG